MLTALITGTSTGIGRATALQLARDGMRVWASMRDTSMGVSLEEIASEEDLDLRVVQLDVKDEQSVEKAFDYVGGIDVLVNNAGLSPVGSVEEFDLVAWKQLFETNVFGLIRCTQAALPSMRAKGFGRVINISSVAGRVAIPMFGPYSSTKWAVEAIGESLASEAAIFGIHVTLIEPGAVATPIRGKTGQPNRESPYRPVAKNWGFSVGYDHARPSEPEEVAIAISTVIKNPSPPLRVTVGRGVEQMIELRSRHNDEEWLNLWSSETGDFLTRWKSLTGDDLTQLPDR
jgi:NAD(P)-dependent dehydrogenase (short-subunit alcohol dehydrogenase family)